MFYSRQLTKLNDKIQMIKPLKTDKTIQQTRARKTKKSPPE